MKTVIVAVAVLLGGAWWAVDKLDEAANPQAPKQTFIGLDDEMLATKLANAEKHWREAAGSVTTIDAPYRSDKELAAIHDEWKALRAERDAREKTRGH